MWITCRSYLYLVFLVFLVVWNPWSEKAKGMSDFGDEEYKEMVCVEAGAVAQQVTLDPSKRLAFSQKITVVN